MKLPIKAENASTPLINLYKSICNYFYLNSLFYPADLQDGKTGKTQGCGEFVQQQTGQ